MYVNFWALVQKIGQVLKKPNISKNIIATYIFLLQIQKEHQKDQIMSNKKFVYSHKVKTFF